MGTRSSRLTLRLAAACGAATSGAQMPDTDPVPMSAEELLATGLVDPSKKDKLEEYIDARRRFDDLFGSGPGLDRLVGKAKDARQRLQEARAELEELAGEARGALRKLEGRALKPLEVILAADAARLEEVKRAFARAREATEGNPESNPWPAALRELLELLARVRAERAGGA